MDSPSSLFKKEIDSIESSLRERYKLRYGSNLETFYRELVDLVGKNKTELELLLSELSLISLNREEYAYLRSVMQELLDKTLSTATEQGAALSKAQAA